ncbi:hypothetical protein R1sor_013700 [Riccia sorocarpa]|uniref:Protein transport protein Sec61 subunit gamma n=1 Tax=Riccia sorocarpa TaxID=122646 RepID=A0ABD3H999_9MARC
MDGLRKSMKTLARERKQTKIIQIDPQTNPQRTNAQPAQSQQPTPNAGASKTKAAPKVRKARRVPKKMFDVSITIGIRGTDIQDKAFDKMANFLKTRPEMDVLGLKRDDSHVQLHIHVLSQQQPTMSPPPSKRSRTLIEHHRASSNFECRRLLDALRLRASGLRRDSLEKVETRISFLASGEESREFHQSYSIRLVKRCHKPDRREFTKVAARTALGFVVMGFTGFFVKLIFIPIRS